MAVTGMEPISAANLKAVFDADKKSKTDSFCSATFSISRDDVNTASVTKINATFSQVGTSSNQVGSSGVTIKVPGVYLVTASANLSAKLTSESYTGTVSARLEVAGDDFAVMTLASFRRNSAVTGSSSYVGSFSLSDGDTVKAHVALDKTNYAEYFDIDLSGTISLQKII